MRTLVGLLAFLALLAPLDVDGRCRCRPRRPARCADPGALHRATVAIDFTVVDGTVEVITQTGLYRVPVGDLDGKTVLFLVTHRNVIFQGFLEDAITIAAGTMRGGSAVITTAPVFAPGEYELALFIDAVPGGTGTGVGPQRGDLAAFDNTICDPTGVTVRFSVGCEDATVMLENRHFIIF
jgi:hypothetical protein